MNDLLRIRSLSKHYDGFDLRNVDLTVPAGSVVGFIGSNGAGKTTTIKAILGLIYPDAGSIELLGQNVGEHAGSKAIKDAKQRTGVVFDTCSFPEEMTVASVGKLMSYSYDSWSPADFEQRLAQFQLPKSKTVKDLSRGMSMKLSLACALAHDPDLLILDEPTNHLDLPGRELVSRYLSRKRGFLLVSHDRAFLDGCVDHILSINRADIQVCRGNFSTWMENRERQDAFRAAEKRVKLLPGDRPPAGYGARKNPVGGKGGGTKDRQRACGPAG